MRQVGASCGTDEWVGVSVLNETLQDDEATESAIADTTLQVADGMGALSCRIDPLHLVNQGRWQKAQPLEVGRPSHDDNRCVCEGGEQVWPTATHRAAGEVGLGLGLGALGAFVLTCL